MSRPDPTSGLVACDECGTPHPVRQAETESADGTTVNCPQCGHDTFTELDDPSSL